MEEIMINTLGFHLTQPYALYFAQRFLRVSEHNDRVKHMTSFLMVRRAIVCLSAVSSRLLPSYDVCP